MIEQRVSVYAPYRAELVGNHSDHQHGLITAMTLSCGISGEATACGGNIVYLQSAGHQSFAVNLTDLRPQASERHSSAALVRGVAAAMARRGFHIGGLRLQLQGSLPEGIGVSGSAAFELVCCQAFSSLYNNNSISAEQCAYIAFEAETEYFGKPCGLMDQYICSSGGAALIDFAADPPLFQRIEPDFAAHGYQLYLIDSGSSHAGMNADFASIPEDMWRIAAALGQKYLRDCDEQQFAAHSEQLLAACGKDAYDRAAHFFAEQKRVKQFVATANQGDIRQMLRLIDQSTDSTVQLLKNIPEHIQEGIRLSRRLCHGQGAVKIQGGGFAGSLLAIVADPCPPAYIAAIEQLYHKGCCISIEAGGIEGRMRQTEK